MPRRTPQPHADVLAGSFGFDPGLAVTHFLVFIPSSAVRPVEISEHFTWNPDHLDRSQHYGDDRVDGQVRCQLPRPKWNDIAGPLRAEFNARLKREGLRPGRWKPGYNIVSRPFGKELTLLAWAIEDADPGLVRCAIANWLGLAPEERWWLYTMTAAATGHAMHGRNLGWRKAVRFALTENPLPHVLPETPTVPAFFQRLDDRHSVAPFNSADPNA